MKSVLLLAPPLIGIALIIIDNPRMIPILVIGGTGIAVGMLLLVHGLQGLGVLPTDDDRKE